MKVLVVEDDDVIASRLKLGLEKAGFQAVVASDGDEGLYQAMLGGYAVIVLDIMLPKRDGWSVCAELRRAKDPVPILMLTARDTVDDRVKGLDLGADDYLPKPFDFREFLARVRALSRRESLNKGQVIHVADLEIDPASRTVLRGGEPIHLTPREFSLLEALARNEGRTLTREIIVEQIWGDEDSLSNTVNFHVVALRRKVDTGRAKGLIQTVHGVGYVLRSSGAEGA
ncbi:MAG: response regulator transcription factor [Fimbriimonadaceae bacterium]|nr:response regulator transcription factor [Fimbriimonadaceae bacterium]